MKRIAAYLVLALFLVRCEPLPVVPVEPPADKMVTITALAGANGTIDPSGVLNIKLGDSKTYIITPSANYSIFSIKVDGMDQPINDTLELKNVLYNRDIKVEFISTKVLLLTEAPWMLKALKVWQDGEVVADLILDEEMKAWSFYFTLGGKVGWCSSPGQCNDNEVYIFSDDENYLLMGRNQEPHKILKLTKDEFVFSVPTTENGKPATFEQTYYRP